VGDEGADVSTLERHPSKMEVLVDKSTRVLEADVVIKKCSRIETNATRTYHEACPTGKRMPSRYHDLSINLRRRVEQNHGSPSVQDRACSRKGTGCPECATCSVEIF
jgi:hypothetical protein